MIFILELIIHYAQFTLIMNLYTVVLSSSQGYIYKNSSYWLANSELPVSTERYYLLNR